MVIQVVARLHNECAIYGGFLHFLEKHLHMAYKISFLCCRYNDKMRRVLLDLPNR
jgi:hypothetical protein